jgi:hypothetical protein
MTGGTTSEIMGLISVLAHEMGHIKFRRDGGRYSTCFGQKFLNASWDTSNLGNTLTRRFRAFGEVVSAPVNVSRPTSATDYDGVYDTYNNGFATLLASSSPEEDCVEGYKVNALTYARGPGKLNIRIPSTTGGGVRVVQVNQARGPNNVLADKMACP